jgi:hypothetical protein
VADLLEQLGHRFDVSSTARRLGPRQSLSEKRGADRSRARLECVCRALDRFRISFFHCLLESSEAYGSILDERIEQGPDYVFDAGVAKVRAETLQVYVRRWPRAFCALRFWLMWRFR